MTIIVQPPGPTGTVETTPNGYSGAYNYVRTYESLGPFTILPVSTDPEYFKKIKETTIYTDGLGRTLQTVMRQATPGTVPKDIVSPVVYDEFHREVFKYMPYVATTSDGSFKLNPFADQKTFMQNQFTGEHVFYSKTDFEASPLNRPKKEYAQGNSWAGSGRGITQQYLINTLANEVKKWSIGSAYTDVPVNGSNLYAGGELYLNKTLDENGNAIAEFKDKEGKLILKKVQVSATITDAYIGWLSTYYVYDDLGMLRFIIPPKAVAWLNVNGWSFSANGGPGVADELCFRYQYDYRNRMVCKKMPGAGWSYMVYDRRDRVIFTQDDNMRAKNQWLSTLYDLLNRPVLTGMISFSGTRASLQANTDADIAAGSNGGTINFGRSATPALSGDIIVNSLQTGTKSYNASRSITMDVGFNSENGSNITFAITNSATSSPAIETVAICDNPVRLIYNFIALTQTYYDNYNFNTNPIRTYTPPANPLAAGTALYPVTAPTAAQQRLLSTRGMVTGTRVRILSDPANLAVGTWLSTVLFYDDKGRILQTHSDNYKGGVDVATNLYNFTGAVLSSLLEHNNLQNPNADLQLLKVQSNMNYDHAGRLLQVSKSLKGATPKIIAVNTYNTIGQLSTKAIGKKLDDSGPLETLDYTYNIRGWLKGINGDYATNPISNSTKWFGMELSYDWGFNNNQYNGNISGIKWISRGDNVQRSYGFGYDKVNRLLFADFAQGASYGDDAIVKFDLTMGAAGAEDGTAYDENGNIRRMQQWGLQLNRSELIDDLKYNYSFGGSTQTNKLLNVIDKQNVETTKLGDFRTSASHPQKTAKANIATDPLLITDYSYDANGNLIKDLNKDIDLSAGVMQGIQYNHLNLPWKINIKNKGSITYTYDALGNKLEKKTNDITTPPAGASNGDKSTSYLGGFVYENNLLQFFGHEEGRVRIVPPLSGSISTFVFDYFIKDHLGNVRVVLTEELQKDIYPVATLEGPIPNVTTTTTSLTYIEKSFYTIDNNYIVATPAGMTSSPNIGYQNNNVGNNNNTNCNTPLCTTALSANVYRLNANTNKTGLGITLRVMAGDVVNISGKSYHKQAAGTTYTNPVALLTLVDVLNTFVGSGIMSTKGLTGAQLNTYNAIPPNPTSFFINQPPQTPALPQAFINYILFDEQFKYVNSGFVQVGASGVLTSHVISNIPVNKNGFIFVYCSNESKYDVFFDNLSITHNRSPILEETHYYPFGLTMSRISSLAAGKIDNKRKFNSASELQNQEFSDGSGLELYATEFRNLDPQIGRWLQIDPRPTDMESPYAAMSNNPIFNNDPLGDTVILGESLKNNTAAMEGFNLLKNTQTFKDQYGKYDVAGGYAGGNENGSDAAKTNVVFDLFNDKINKGLTKLTLADGNDNQKELYDKVNKSKVSKDTKAQLTIYLDPTIHTTKTGFAVGFNHESSVHGNAFLKVLSTLREGGNSAFFSELKRAGTFSDGGETKASFSLRYLSIEYSHGQVGAGDNNTYNQASQQIRIQLSPTERKTYDAKVSANLKWYSDAAKIYNRLTQ